MSVNPSTSSIVRPEMSEMVRSGEIQVQPKKISLFLEGTDERVYRAAWRGTAGNPLVVHSNFRVVTAISCGIGVGAGLAVGLSYAPPLAAAGIGGCLGFTLCRERLIRETAS